MKQCTANPKPKSERCAWQLLTLCLQCFPPDVMVEHFVERYIRTRTGEAHASKLITIMYESVRQGPLRKVPAEAQLARMLEAADEEYSRESKVEEMAEARPELERRPTAMNAEL